MAGKKKKPNNSNEIARNKKAYFDYEIIERYEAGIVLKGTEIKSLRAKKCSLQDTYAVFKKDELFVINMHIAPYDFGNRNNHDPLRSRKLLLHRSELKKLLGKTKVSGSTLTPLRLYLVKNKVKIEIALVRGKKKYDKRETIRKREQTIEMERYIKSGR